tara:strand:- start:2623 stop:2874 length:252 start_codon:yes stop_codon:yes gene_type:complete
MKTTYKMKEAVNVQEAKISILDVMEENPLWLNKVTSSLSILIKNIEPEHRQFILDKSIDEQVLDLYVKLKSEYYNYKENTQWS